MRSMLDREPDLQIIDEAKDGQETVELTRLQRPDLVLMDVRMPTVNGFEATRTIKGGSPLGLGGCKDRCRRLRPKAFPCAGATGCHKGGASGRVAIPLNSREEVLSKRDCWVATHSAR